MPDPFIFVTTHTINEGEFDSIKELSRTFTDLVEAADSGLIAFHFYISDDGTEVSNIQVHADAKPSPLWWREAATAMHSFC
ncbi:MAG TPA: hypothetical protein VE623_01020 [Acidimicrobiales bacterium]|jgi:hypothetical protein|nr:hypothetical protein [Acidimicrobiales bacterium]